MTGTITHRHGQHTWHDHDQAEYEQHQQPIDDERIMIEGEPDELTDGYHTMEELYDHRRAMTAVIAAWAASMPEPAAWRSKAHHIDSDPMFDGYFIVGIELDTGTITYHYDLKYWDDFAAVPEITYARRWDGASPDECVNRLLRLARQMAEGPFGDAGR